MKFSIFRKNYISGYIWPRSFIQTVKCSLLDENVLIKCLWYTAHVKLFFTSRKVVFFMRWQVACEMFISLKCSEDLVEKNLSGYIWHRLFILTVNCSFLNQITVNQSFYGMLLTFSYFLPPGEVLCFALGGKWHARCLSVLSVSETLSKNYISGYIWHKSFFQTVKCSFFHQITVQKSYYDRLSDKKKFKEDNGTRGESNLPKFAYEQTWIGTTRSHDS